MTLRRARIIVMVAVLTLLALVPASALLSGDSPLDRLVAMSPVIVKARITHTEGWSEAVSFSATVLAIVKEDGLAVPRDLQAHLPVQVWALWPSDGWPLREQQTVLLMLERDSRRGVQDSVKSNAADAAASAGLRVINCVNAIIPALDQLIEYPGRSSPTTRVFLELKAAIESMPDGLPKARALATLSSVASVADSQAFLSYAASGNEWMRSAALASLARIDPRPATVTAMLEDLRRRGALDKGWETVFRDYGTKVWFDLEDVSRCGAWATDKAMCDRARAYLPVYRAFADASGETSQSRLAIEALMDLGTTEDLLRLYRHHNDTTVWVRHDVLEGLGRILGLSLKKPVITSYSLPLDPEVAEWEKTAQAAVEAALKVRGVI